MNLLKPNDQRAKNLIIIFWILMALYAISAISNYFQLSLLNRAFDGEDISLSEASSNDLRVQLLNILCLIGYLISVVFFILWFRRAYYNLSCLKETDSKDGWAAGAWFVPFYNLYKPYKIMMEIFQKTKFLFEDFGITPIKEVNISIIGWWWGIWIFVNFFGNFNRRYSQLEHSISALISQTELYIVHDLCLVGLCFIVIKMVKPYMANEPLLLNLNQGDEGEIIISRLTDDQE